MRGAGGGPAEQLVRRAGARRRGHAPHHLPVRPPRSPRRLAMRRIRAAARQRGARAGGSCTRGCARSRHARATPSRPAPCRQGDACALSPTLGPFQAVLASNLLCRRVSRPPLRGRAVAAASGRVSHSARTPLATRRSLPSPRAFLASLPRLVAPGGVAVLVSPYSWLEEYTPQEEWLGGCVRGGSDVSSAPALKAAMARARKRTHTPARNQAHHERRRLRPPDRRRLGDDDVRACTPLPRRRRGSASRWSRSWTCRFSSASTARPAARLHARPAAARATREHQALRGVATPRSTQVSVRLQPRHGVEARGGVTAGALLVVADRVTGSCSGGRS